MKCSIVIRGKKVSKGSKNFSKMFLKLSSFRFQTKRESWNGLNEERERERESEEMGDNEMMLTLQKRTVQHSQVQEENRMYHLNGVGTNEESRLKEEQNREQKGK